MNEQDIANMTERELKNIVNDYRTNISRNEKALKAVFNELKLHRTNIDELKQKRDDLNAKVKEIATQAREEKNKRDEVNKQISEYKSERDNLRSEKDKITNDISGLKAKRDEFNKISKGSVESLSRAYCEELDKFLNADIPLNHEQNIFERLKELNGRIEAAKEADATHKKIIEIYQSCETVFSKNGNVGDSIKTLAEESQQHHLKMHELYKQVDELRKEADTYHAQIKETYKITSPIREKIEPLKAKTAQLRDELSVYLEKLNDIQLQKDEQKQNDHHTEAREKLEKSGKLSLQDLKVLMEKGDIKF